MYFFEKNQTNAKITDNITFLIFYYFEACNDNFIQINKYFYFKVPTAHLMIFFQSILAIKQYYNFNYNV